MSFLVGSPQGSPTSEVQCLYENSLTAQQTTEQPRAVTILQALACPPVVRGLRPGGHTALTLGCVLGVVSPAPPPRTPLHSPLGCLARCCQQVVIGQQLTNSLCGL